MGLAYEEAALIKADADIADADERIRRQEVLIVELQRDGHKTDLAYELLKTLQATRQVMDEHRQLIIKTIADIKAGRR